MGFTHHQTRNLFIFSTLASGIGLLAAVLMGLSRTGLLLAGGLFALHLAALWMISARMRPGLWLLRRMEAPGCAESAFLVGLSVTGGGLGLLSWIPLFAPGSQVREALVQAGPVIGWGAASALVWLAGAGAVLNAEGEKKNGLLVLAVLFAVAGHLFFFWLAAQLFTFTIDDAYITFRYSKNLAAGWGPTYNPGQPPVEGYTTFLWMLAMALPHFAGVNVATFSKVTGVLALCGTFLLTGLLTYDLARSQPAKARLFFAAFSAFVVAALPISAVHAVSGMETALFALLVSLLAWCVARGVKDGSRLLFWAPLVGLLTGLTRPEGNIVALLLLGYGYLSSLPDRRKRLLWGGAGLYLLPGAIYFLWRAWYYGLPLPLPFYMKVLRAGAFAGAGEVGSYLLYLLPGLVALLLPALLRFRREYLPAALPVAFLLVFYLFPVHAMGFEWRFVYPSAPLIAALAGVGGAELFGLLAEKTQSRWPWEWLLAGLLLVGAGNLGELDGLVRSKQSYGSGISNYKSFGTLLSEFDDTHTLTLAIGDAGTVPYYADWQVIDLFGLNSREIGLGETPVFALVFEQQPADLILLSVGDNPNRISDEHAGAQALYQEAVRRGMAHIGAFPFGRDSFIWVVGYPGTELAGFIQKGLEGVK
ncbi:MAG: hypothetical protein ACOYYU_11470 [Chloroflexota bacterium]